MPLPEYTEYRDTGCDLHPACLSCPFERCRYDTPRGERWKLNTGRDREIIRLFLAGASPALAQRYGLTERSIFRIARRIRENRAA